MTALNNTETKAMDYLTHLNHQQRQAVLTPSQHVLVLAGAGSGKTRVLTSRIAHLVHSGAASVQEVLAVTFTNKAAREMLERLNHMLPVPSRHAYIGTFHGLCHRFLRIHHEKVGLIPNFQIMDMQDQQSLVKKLYKTHNISEEKYPLKNAIQFINQAKERGQRAKDVTPSLNDAPWHEIYALYQQSTDAQHLLDFGELLLRCDELLVQHPDVCRDYQARFQHVLIDEFQDTNLLQYRWLLRFAGKDNHFFAVGDDDQSIYGFRGACVGNLHTFAHDFKAEVIKLEQNYRSDAPILECANAVIRNNTQRLGKELFTQNTAGEPVRVHHATNYELETLWIIEQIKQLIEQGVQAQDIAILYRTNAQSRIFEHMFFQHQLPYRVYGGLRFFERAEIKHAMAYLQLMHQVDNDGAYARVVNFPARGIGLKTLEQATIHAQQQGVSLYQAAQELGGKVLGFNRLIDEWRQATKDMPLMDVVSYILENSGLGLTYAQEKDAENRLQNLKELISAAYDFSRQEGYLDISAHASIQNADISTTPLGHFLAFSSLDAGGSGDDAQSLIQMMSIHASKGLEFDHVFLAGLEEGVFPGYAASQDDAQIEEERRLMYVAITRARRRLHISFASSRVLYGSVNFNRPSRFLSELPDAATLWSPAKPKAQTAKSISETLTHTAVVNKTKKDRALKNFTSKSAHIGQQTFFEGQNVFSPKFGEGTIKQIDGQNEAAIALIHFKRHGTKTLQLGLAKLDIV